MHQNQPLMSLFGHWGNKLNITNKGKPTRKMRAVALGVRPGMEDEMESPSPDVACREVILEWSNIQELSEFAKMRIGYCNSDNGSGVNYPEDLDEYQREVEGIHIPDGFVLVFGYTTALPPGYELLVKEETYLQVLESVLSEAGCTHESKAINDLLRTLA